MFNLYHYLLYASILIPNSSTYCKTSEVCPIEWTNSIHGHLEMQVYKNNEWVSYVNSEQHFLSMIVDETKQDYDWIVPYYLNNYWYLPKRISLKNLLTNEMMYSENFNILGVTFDSSIKPIVDYNDNIILNWSTNENTSFRLELVKQNEEYIRTDSYSLCCNETINWSVPYFNNDDLTKLKLISDTNYSYDFSNLFRIEVPLITTQATTTSTVQSSEDEEFPLWLIPIIVWCCGITFFAIYKCYKCYKNNKVEPDNNCDRSIVNPVYENRIYEDVESNRNYNNPVYVDPRKVMNEVMNEFKVKRTPNPLYKSV